MRITLAAYSPAWPRLFEDEKALLERSLPVPTVVEHIGSTSVPGLAAKPIIDILLGLADFAVADSLIPAMLSLGYEYLAQHETVMPYRRFFSKEKDGVRTHHVHLVEVGSAFWNRHLAFRDYLRTHPDTAAQYEALKRELATQEWASGNDYAGAKTPFIRRIEATARS